VIKPYYGVAAAALLLGLFPVFFLPMLQLILLVALVGVVVSLRSFDRAIWAQCFSWRYVVLAQFYIYFFLNAAFYPVWDGARDHARAIALESWFLGLIGLFVLVLWLHIQKVSNIKKALMLWLPAGLTFGFLVATIIYVSGSQGPRVELFATSALGPPFWFLILTMAGFSWFSEMGFWHRVWRLCLLLMAGVMAIYGGARLVMLAWILCAMALAVWLYIQAEPKHRPRILLGICMGMIVCIGGVLFADFLAGGRLTNRMALLFQVELNYESISAQFLRLKIWTGAMSVIAEHPVWGVGKVNERIALRQEMEWDRWLRAHQTYLSYLIAGGLPALISGVLMQSPVMTFVSAANRSALFPAFLGLGVVVTMNCLTDSIFQSGVAVQTFMAMLLFFLRASDVDQPILAPQKQVSPAIK
jgi:hypothetical protein